MAIQYPTFRADPNLKPDFSGVANLPKNIMQGIQIGMLPQKIKQDKQAQDLKNALVQQQMQKAQAQAQMYGQHAGLYNLQQQYYPQSAQADIASKQAQATLARQKASIYQTIMGQPQQQQAQPGQPQQMQQQQLSAAMSQSQRQPRNAQEAAMMAQQGSQQAQMGQQPGMQQPPGQPLMPQQQMQQQPKQQPGLGPYKSLTTQQKLGMAAIGIKPADVYPAQVEREKAQAQSDVKFLDTVANDTSVAAQQGAIYQAFMDEAANPDFVNAIGPVNSAYQRINPTGNIGEITGRLDMLSGLLQKTVIQLSPRAGAAMSNFAKTFKPSPKDTAPILYGKVAAGKAAAQWQVQFNKAIENNMNSGMSKIQSVAKAENDVPMKPMMDKYTRLMNETKAAAAYKGKYKDQQIRATGDSVTVSVPGSNSFVAPSQLTTRDNRFYVRLPGTNKSVPAEVYDEVLAAGRGG